MKRYLFSLTLSSLLLLSGCGNNPPQGNSTSNANTNASANTNVNANASANARVRANANTPTKGKYANQAECENWEKRPCSIQEGGDWHANY
jgi:hypothetical protein